MQTGEKKMLSQRCDLPRRIVAHFSDVKGHISINIRANPAHGTVSASQGAVESNLPLHSLPNPITSLSARVIVD